MARNGIGPHTTGRTAFVMAQPKDAAQVARALSGSGYRVVDPVELDELAGLTRDQQHDVAAVVERDLRVLFECDLVVMAPDCERLPWAVALAATAGNRKMEMINIEKLVPSWRKA